MVSDKQEDALMSLAGLHNCRHGQRQRLQPVAHPHCDELLRTTIAELMQLAHKEYLRGLREGTNLLRAQVTRRMKELRGR